MLTNFCTDGTPNSQTPHTIEFEGVKRPTTENSTPPLFHGHLNKFPAACHVFESGEVTIAWYKMAKEDRDNAFIHPYFKIDQGGKVLIISKDVDYTVSNWVKANPSLAHTHDTRVMIRQNYGICAAFTADSIFVVEHNVQMGIPVGCDGVEGDISSFEALINELYLFRCCNDFELSHLVSSMKPTANVPEVDMERRLTTLLSHPWYLTSVDQNDICVEAWSMISKNNLGYDVGKEFNKIYKKYLGQSKLDWKQNFLKQPNGQSLKTFVPNFDKLDKSDGMAFLHCSRICISHAIYKVGMTETDVHETLKNSFPEFMAILFETLWIHQLHVNVHSFINFCKYCSFSWRWTVDDHQFIVTDISQPYYAGKAEYCVVLGCLEKKLEISCFVFAFEIVLSIKGEGDFDKHGIRFV
ncbi:hypothetical protein ACFX2C_017099 [Malus domestica]